MKNFFTEALAELRNVTWPTKAQAIHSMITVLSIMLMVGVFLTVVDSGFNEVIMYALEKFK